jgi:hypothetical protein
MIKNVVINKCIIIEGTSSWVMYSHVWNNLGYPMLITSMITLRVYDGWPYQIEWLYKKFPI